MEATTEEKEFSAPDFSRRHVDPIVQWKWEAATKVTPADLSKGIRIGVITYPDKTHQIFQR